MFYKFLIFIEKCSRINKLEKGIIKIIFIERDNEMKFNKDTKIGEILEVAPEKADILIEIGMHCLGCPASQMETLEEACEVHGIDVEEVVNKLNEE